MEENPVSLSANKKIGYALQKLKRPAQEWKKYQVRYKKLLDAIVRSGNGLSPESAFKVIYPSDEHHVIKDYLGFPTIHEQVLVGLCDKYLIEPNENYKEDELYFDISRKLTRQDELLHKN